MKNPFSIVFGKNPDSMINSRIELEEIIDDLRNGEESSPVYMLTGIRGVGKTVSMTRIANALKDEEDWIIVNLNPERDLFESLLAELRSRPVITEAAVSLSFLGVGLEIKGGRSSADTVVMISRLLKEIKEKNKKLLITIDEVTNNHHLKEFVSQYQIFLREEYPVYLIMTGLYENVSKIQDEESLTFLYRTPKIKLGSLSINSMAHSYKKYLDIEDVQAKEMALFTKGYPYAFQVLGYLCWKNKMPYQDMVIYFDEYMEEYVYQKIWSELSLKDKEIIRGMSQTESSKVKDVRDTLHINSNEFNRYRKRLIDKGLIRQSTYGHLEFTLPRFDTFALNTWDI